MRPLEGKRVLVTGGTGSLGKQLVWRVLGGSMGRPEKVTVFSRDEAKQHEMRLAHHHRRMATDEIIYEDSGDLLTFKIGDVRDLAAVGEAIQGVDVIFHAAALKQVPACEYSPREAVRTNIDGAINLVQAVRENPGDVEVVVGISTDKACKPVNVMGMTKALQERVLLEANLRDLPTRFLCVRYGNVLASRGSVVPMFLDQISRGGPVTVTTKEMTRFFLTLDRAVDTVLAAVETGQAGETYVPRVPAARIVDMVDALAHGKEIEVVYTGIRPGEKVHEIMISEEERHRTIARGDYFVILPVLPELRTDVNPVPVFDGEYSSEEITLDAEGLRELLAPYRDELPAGASL